MNQIQDFIVPNVAFNANHYSNHQLVAEMFPDSRPLFRVEGRHLRIRAPQAPTGDWQAKAEAIPLPQAGQTLEFDLLANCSYKTGFPQKRVQMRPNEQNYLDEWLWKRCLGWGFAPIFYEIDAELLLMKDKDKRVGKEGLERIWHINSTSFVGTLEVRDADLFSHHLLNGFSQAKAYGFGLMTTKVV